MKNRNNNGVRPGAKVKKSSVKQFICLVDCYRRPSRQRNTYGRYRVGAKTAAQAKAFLQKAIGFGSVLVYYEEPADKCDAQRPAAYGECLLERTGIGVKGPTPVIPAGRYDMPIGDRAKA